MSTYEEIDVDLLEADGNDENDENDENDDKDDADYFPPKSQRSKPPKSAKVVEEGKKKQIAVVIKKYPWLWDKKNKFYRNQVRRNGAWETVATEIHSTGT